MRKVMPLRPGVCPEGYEFVHGHNEKSGIRVSDYCRKVSKTKMNLHMKMEYPGKTHIKGTLKMNGMKGHIDTYLDSDTFMSGDNFNSMEFTKEFDNKLLDEGKKKNRRDQ